ncbi:hypothetical protein [Streptomyces abikoensis]|uniref:hypothetical protein n=1 Tax=Streptomyces abikoensis TaxID=97398 RepID=UPI0016782933|nr:hypothetical protein [Streptomyces abikoensis]
MLRIPDGRVGLHVFAGRANGADNAVAAARAVYEQAVHAQSSGREIPSAGHDGWTARGLRLGWELAWNAATATVYTTDETDLAVLDDIGGDRSGMPN